MSPTSNVETRSGFHGPLHAAARIAVLAGAVGSMGFLLNASAHRPPVLIVLFIVWMVSPFVVLGLADRFSKRWAASGRTTLQVVMLVVALGALAIYGAEAVKHRWGKPAFVYVVVPLVSWLLMAIAIPIAAFASGSASRRPYRHLL